MPKLLLQRAVVFWSIALVGCAADLWTKHWVFAWLGFPCKDPYWMVDGHVGLQTSLNRGALFGIGQGQVWFFASVSVAAALAIVYWLFVAGGARDRFMNIALGAIMAGILGNLYDRLGMWSLPNLAQADCSAVRDWILVQWSDRWRWPNFNIADSLLVGGATALFLFGWRREPAQQAQATE